MAHPVRKNYKPGSPGFARKLAGVTLSQLRQKIAASDDRTAMRRNFVEQNLLAERKP